MVGQRSCQCGVSHVESLLSPAFARTVAHRRPRRSTAPANFGGGGGNETVAAAGLAHGPRREISPTNSVPSIAMFGGHRRVMLARRRAVRRSHAIPPLGRAAHFRPYCSPVARHSNGFAHRRAASIASSRISVSVPEVRQVFPAWAPLPWHYPDSRGRRRVPRCSLLPIPPAGMMAPTAVTNSGASARRSAGPLARRLVRSGSKRRRRGAFCPPSHRPRLPTTTAPFIIHTIATRRDKGIRASHPSAPDGGAVSVRGHDR